MPPNLDSLSVRLVTIKTRRVKMTMINSSNNERSVQLCADARRQGFLRLDHGQAGDEAALRLAWLAWDAHCDEKRVPRMVLDVFNEEDRENCCLEFYTNLAGSVWPLDRPLECPDFDGEAYGITVTALFSDVLHPIVKVEADVKKLDVLLRVATEWAERFGTTAHD
jgi:hypothetical protein